MSPDRRPRIPAADRLSFVTQVRLHDRQRRYVELQAALEWISISDVVRQALDQAIEQSHPDFRKQLELPPGEFEQLLEQVREIGAEEASP